MPICPPPPPPPPLHLPPPHLPPSPPPSLPSLPPSPPLPSLPFQRELFIRETASCLSCAPHTLKVTCQGPTSLPWLVTFSVEDWMHACGGHESFSLRCSKKLNPDNAFVRAYLTKPESLLLLKQMEGNVSKFILHLNLSHAHTHTNIHARLLSPGKGNRKKKKKKKKTKKKKTEQDYIHIL